MMMVIQSPSPAHEVLICAHCQQPFKGKTFSAGDRHFCCRGCGAAWSFIHELGLSSFYQLIQCAGAVTDAAGPVDAAERLALFDDARFQASFVTAAASGTARVAHLTMSGMTCYACVWLCEQAVSRGFPGARIEVNLSRGSAQLHWHSEQHRLSELIGLLNHLGFSPTPRTAKDEPSQRHEIIQLGVAAICAMNVMGFALAEYLTPAARPDDLNPFYFHLFRWLSLIVSLPAVTFAALPFYQASLRFLRQRRVSIDQAIAFSILISFAFSTWNTLIGAGAVYFDSICAGITLLLGGRIIQKLVLRRADDSIRRLYQPADGFARVIQSPESQGHPHDLGVSSAAGENLVPISQIHSGDHLRILPGELIPVSGRITKGAGEVSSERITGEPGFTAVAPGFRIVGGSTNGSTPLIIEAAENGMQSWIWAAQKTIDAMQGERSRYTVMTEKLATGFFVAVVGCAAAALVTWWGSGADTAFSRAVATILIACPCAFGIAAPITFAAGAARALRDGVVFRSPAAIERVAAVKKVFFDKTGTLTAGTMSIERAEIFDAACIHFGLEPTDLKNLVGAMSEGSGHQWAVALHQWATLQNATPTAFDRFVLTDYKEVFGKGIQANWRGHRIRLGSQRFVQGTTHHVEGPSTCLFIDDELLAVFTADDLLLPGALSCIEDLRALKLQIALLSGDQTSRTSAVASQLGISEYSGELSPEEKFATADAKFEAGVPADKAVPRIPSAMIGNGFNDSLALAGAFAGIAVFGAAPAAREAADVYIAEPGLNRVSYAFRHARATMKTLWLAYGFAGVYNLTGVALAFYGMVTPGVAAAMMPVASLVIVRIATLDLQRGAGKWKLLWSWSPSVSASPG